MVAAEAGGHEHHPAERDQRGQAAGDDGIGLLDEQHRRHPDDRGEGPQPADGHHRGAAPHGEREGPAHQDLGDANRRGQIRIARPPPGDVRDDREGETRPDDGGGASAPGDDEGRSQVELLLDGQGPHVAEGTGGLLEDRRVAPGIRHLIPVGQVQHRPQAVAGDRGPHRLVGEHHPDHHRDDGDEGGREQTADPPAVEVGEIDAAVVEIVGDQPDHQESAQREEESDAEPAAGDGLGPEVVGHDGEDGQTPEPVEGRDVDAGTDEGARSLTGRHHRPRVSRNVEHATPSDFEGYPCLQGQRERQAS